MRVKFETLKNVIIGFYVFTVIALSCIALERTVQYCRLIFNSSDSFSTIWDVTIAMPFHLWLIDFGIIVFIFSLLVVTLINLKFYSDFLVPRLMQSLELCKGRKEAVSKQDNGVH